MSRSKRGGYTNDFKGGHFYPRINTSRKKAKKKDEEPLDLPSIMERYGWEKEEPMELYRDVFRLDEDWIQDEWEPAGEFKANPIILGCNTGGKMKRRILFRDTFEKTLKEFQRLDFAVIGGCTYFGKANVAEHQSKLFAMIFDLDGVTNQSFSDLFFGMGNDVLPFPQHVVLSGHGAHLYYVFEVPVPLYPNLKIQLKTLKHALTAKFWGFYSKQSTQYQGLNQAFRIPGSRAKEGAPVKIVQAYRVNKERTTVEKLNTYVNPEYRVDMDHKFSESKVSLEEAKKRWPDWYSRVIERREPSRKQWYASEKLYLWWLNKIATSDEVVYGHRYFCIMMLAIYAAKCGIYDRERVRNDALSLMDRFQEVGDGHEFTVADIDSALECLDGRYVTFPRKEIERLSAIRIDPCRRNGRPRELHLELARANLAVLNKANGRPLQGRKNKRQEVLDWRERHPHGRKIDCQRDTGLADTTVHRWWNDFDSSQD